MMEDHPNGEAPYEPHVGYLVPRVSLALSLPTLVGALTLSGVALYHALTGQTFGISAPPFLQSPLGFAVVVCTFVFGPILGGMLCLTQRTRTEQIYGSALLLGFRMKSMNTLALYTAGLPMGVLMLPLIVGMLLRGGT
ncbi:MAG: hypothetical protein ACXWQ5_10890 [Ktedonobacterales bacterium]